MSDRRQTSGLSATVVEEAYLNLQKALSVHRTARNKGEAAAPDHVDDPDVNLQEAVLRFHELLRPYVKDAPGLEEYWEGSVAAHPDDGFESTEDARRYYLEHSTGCWQLQQQWEPVPVQPAAAQTAGAQALADGGAEPDTLEGWHDMLNLPKTARVGGAVPAPGDDPLDGWFILVFAHSIIGLRDLASWEVEQQTVRKHGEGFMAGETAEATVYDPEPSKKILVAARMLVECAVEMGALAQFDTVDDREAEYPYGGLI